MQDYGLNIKRERTPDAPRSSVITDLPGKDPHKMPKDLPSPRHRPNEPIMYDPPAPQEQTSTSVSDPTYDPISGASLNDPMRG